MRNGHAPAASVVLPQHIAPVCVVRFGLPILLSEYYLENFVLRQTPVLVQPGLPNNMLTSYKDVLNVDM